MGEVGRSYNYCTSYYNIGPVLNHNSPNWTSLREYLTLRIGPRQLSGFPRRAFPGTAENRAFPPESLKSHRLSVLPSRAAPETNGFPLPRIGLLPEYSDSCGPNGCPFHRATPPGGVKSHHTGSTEPGSARHYCLFTQDGPLPEESNHAIRPSPRNYC